MKEINTILIVGGGSAGFMTAATLLHEFPNKKITLIESPDIPIIGVGESTIGHIRNWTSLLEIDDKDFLKHTDGSYKLSIKFTDFYKKGESFHYPFGLPYLNGNKAILNDWWFKKFIKKDTPNSDYAECHYPQMALVNANKCFYNEENENPFQDKNSEMVKEKIDVESLDLVKDAYQEAKRILLEKSEELLNFSENLQNKTVLYKTDFHI
jgi:tryptophan halogenase